jgi:hypothetical protein
MATSNRRRFLVKGIGGGGRCSGAGDGAGAAHGVGPSGEERPKRLSDFLQSQGLLPSMIELEAQPPASASKVQRPECPRQAKGGAAVGAGRGAGSGDRAE